MTICVYALPWVCVGVRLYVHVQIRIRVYVGSIGGVCVCVSVDVCDCVTCERRVGRACGKTRVSHVYVAAPEIPVERLTPTPKQVEEVSGQPRL